jgi:hypothetical protein
MSTFSCICGKVTREDEEPRDASGVLYSIADLREAEDRIAQLLADYFHAADRRAWARANFGTQYPEDASDQEVVSDVFSGELAARFMSVFRCPHCGRVAMKGREEVGWRFFESVRPGH